VTFFVEFAKKGGLANSTIAADRRQHARSAISVSTMEVDLNWN
jgi:hypothetical protein